MYCLHKFHWTPSFYLSLDPYEKAFVIAAIDIKAEKEKKHREEIESKTKGG